jgi:glycerol-3-phosphate dehydrogenase
MVPEFGEVRLIRSYTGVRPLLAPRENTGGDNRSINRGFQIIDHGGGLVSILGGKLTTYRLMAEKIVDHICDVFGIKQPCTTAERPLDGQETIPGYPLSKRLENLSDVVCECELVDRKTVERVARETATGDIGDIQHRTRLGMGPCQGGFCTYRALGIMHDVGGLPVGEREEVLKRFLQRRFRGIVPVLWGDQLREEQLVESIYLSAMGMKNDDL